MHPAPKVQIQQRKRPKRNGKTLFTISLNLYLAK
nr:MAG TPA: hypothetical protein [Ackermannviridae sp.]